MTRPATVTGLNVAGRSATLVDGDARDTHRWGIGPLTGDGELGAVFGGLAGDAAKAGENIADSVAEVVDKAAGAEEANLDAVLRTEERNAKVLVGDRTPVVGAPGPPTIGDPAFERGPLGPEFSPGVVDPAGLFLPKESVVAHRLALEGWRVDAREIDNTTDNQPNPDAMVRKGPDDPGSITEFKTLDRASPNAINARSTTPVPRSLPTERS